MGQVRWSVDPNATVALRFTDEDFIEALQNDKGRETKALALLLEVEDAADYDFSEMVEDGVVITARESITGPEYDHLQVVMQLAERKGTRYNAADYNRDWWATWVRGLSDEVDGIPPKLRQGMASSDKRQREEAISSRQLPKRTRQMLFARLRAHEDAVNMPALRDPKRPPTTHDED